MIDIGNLEDKGIAAALREMVEGGELPVLEGMMVAGCGGPGTVTHGPTSVMWRGRFIATVGTPYVIPADAHGCPACPHFCRGHIITGSNRYFGNGAPIATVGSMGVHSACCGPNQATLVEGLSWVDEN